MFVLLDKENIKNIYHQSRIYAKQKPETVEEFKSLVNKTVVDCKQNGKARGACYTISDDVKEIVKFSEVIVKARIKEDSLYIWNADICSYKLEILEALKGEVPKEIAVYALIEDNLVMGDEYLMLLSKPDYKVTERYKFSSYYSCISINDDKKCEEYKKYINEK